MSITRRKSNNRQIPTQICISCEGQTEKIYFIHLRKLLRDRNKNNIIQIKIDKARKQNADGVVRNAKTKYYDGEFNKEFRKNTKIYCVFDKDKNTPKQISDAIRIAKQIKAEIIFSNPNFEVWFYAHYKEDIKHISKSTLNNFLSKNENLGANFKAENNNNFGRLKNKIDNAVKTAKKIQKKNKYEDEGNPHTDVFKIIEYIEQIIQEKI